LVVLLDMSKLLAPGSLQQRKSDAAEPKTEARAAGAK
jgi:hypothetical protein